MATQLKNIVRFSGLAIGVPVALPHGLNISGRAIVPDTVKPATGGFTITADDTNVTVTRGTGADSVDVLVEHWHSFERNFGPVNTLDLTPQPWVLEPGLGNPGGFSPGRTITVALTEGDESTIEDGIAAAAALVPPPSAASPALVWVFPGTYVEDALVVPTGVSVVGGGPDAQLVNVVPSGAGIVQFTLANSTTLRGLTIIGTGLAGITGARLAAPGLALVLDVRAIDVDVGFEGTGVGATLTLLTANALRTAAGGVGTAAVRALAGATVTASVFAAVGNAVALWTDGFLASGVGTRLTVTSFRAEFCIDGGDADDSATLGLSTGRLRNNTNALHVRATGAGGILRSFSLSILDSTAFDILTDGVGSWFDSGSTINESLRSLASATTLVAASISENSSTAEPALAVLGELHVGSETRPAESVFGEGDSHIRGLRAFRSVSLAVGPFTDVTAEVSSPSGSTAAVFDTGVVGNTFFLGGDVAFPNTKVDTTTAIVLGAGALVWEFSDGVGGWVAFKVMSADGVAPYLSYSNDIFGRVANEQVRFGTMTGWAAQAVDGVSKFWIRVRVVTAAITTVPVVEFMKLGTNRTEIQADGVIEHFGTGELEKDLVWHQRLTDDLSGASPGNGTLTLSTNISLTPVDNRFNNNALDGFGGIFSIPEGLDTAHDIRLIFTWIPKANTAGDVEFETNAAEISIGDVLDGTIVDVADAAIETLPINQQDILFENSFDFDVELLAPGDFLAFSLFRDATGGNPDDTFAGNIDIVTVRLVGTFWR